MWTITDMIEQRLAFLQHIKIMKIEETTLKNGTPTFYIEPEEGKALMRVSDGRVFLSGITLCNTWYIGGVKLDEPHWETPDDYIEVDAPEEESEEEIIPEEDEDVEPIVDPIEQARSNKIKALEAYDNSIKVNGFFVGESLTWIDRDTRNTYKASIEAAELLGESSIVVPILGMILNIPIEKGKIALAKIQRYADACAIVTATHKMAISGLDSEEEIMGYDFTLGYPEKLVFDPTEYLN